ncbi:MAG: dual specificity protein phosphatase family protein [Planctomycetes bacterium]|nr:dual specificity protein phosphatase family protein [Planctomycetota bacterium]
MSKIKVAVVLAFLLGVAVGAGAMYLIEPSGSSKSPSSGSSGPVLNDSSGSDEGKTPARTSDRTPADKLERPGLNNFARLSPTFYRGQQPTAEGVQELKKLGVRTIINLRVLHSDRDEIAETGLAYEHIYFDPLHPEDEDMVRFLQIVNDKNREPFFVHCKHGSDRTGTVCALYRIVMQGWSKEDALKEMTDGGYGFHEEFFQNLVRYIQKLDVDAIKKKAGIDP